MLGDVEQIAGPRQVEVAVGIELPDKLVRVMLEVRLDLEHASRTNRRFVCPEEMRSRPKRMRHSSADR